MPFAPSHVPDLSRRTIIPYITFCSPSDDVFAVFSSSSSRRRLPVAEDGLSCRDGGLAEDRLGNRDGGATEEGGGDWGLGFRRGLGEEDE
ncbi:hypothetical protein LIER_39485 [Lithospermum erythrorhizon]|uniref:Uncharacterized protein n=1 Tax=Lithospermum erythrorhizon TaxID=34254 RepID=A0AAV3QIN6_LITER